MEKSDKVILQYLIDEFRYGVSEIRLGNVPNTWCVSKIHEDKINYIVFTEGGTQRYFNEYRQSILEKTSGLNMNVQVYECFLKKNVEDVINPHMELLAINFSKETMEVYGMVDESVLYEIQSSLQYYKSRSRGSGEFFHENKIVVALMAVNILAYIIEIVSNIKIGGGILDIDISVVYKLGALTNISYIGNEFYRFITNMFLHGGLLHIASNMYALFAIGPLVRQVYGEKKFLIIYFGSGLIASLLTSLTLEGVAVGASGAIFGLLGATLVFAYRAKKKIGKGLLLNILSVIAINIFIGLSVKNISNMAHMAGLVAGMLISSFMYVYTYKKK
ncbi:rhomboid protease GluP [Hathewaya proteolytica DSM 3090]|uniref:Rhomboid protease GluP n=1 Tax=Hathewaya proteolytica DSM 3090 TaxID=1121331 RepID=A0A1M6KLR6_9CLOT|nr:rhomboid family intramembrane serine protease [Hathewaya proteolytica]SHJ59882.1 rhomboid protease GluP [Hathewaya proteolytica DSM 3090]